MRFNTKSLLVFVLISLAVAATPEPSSQPSPQTLGQPSSQSFGTTYKDLEFSTKSQPEATLTAREVSDDASEILFALNSAYSGKKFLPGAQFKTLETALQSLHEPMTALELCKKVKSAMLQVSDRSLDAWVKGKECTDEPSDRLEGHVGSNYFQSEERVWDVSTKTVGNSYALLISFTSFPHHNNPEWNGFIEAVKAGLEKTQLVIIDLRGLRSSSVTDDIKGAELSTLLAGKVLQTPYQKQWSNLSPESLQLRLNVLLADRWFSFESQAKAVPDYLNKLITGAIQKRDQAVKGKLLATSDAEEIGDAGGVFDEKQSIGKPIYILMDHACALNCESTIDFFEANRLVKKVGENTAGSLHFVNNGLVVLNHSAIRVQMATAYSAYKDGRSLEKKGIPPDVRVPPKQDAMDFAVNDFLATKALHRKE